MKNNSNKNIIDKFKEHPVIALLMLCIAVSGATWGVSNTFYQKQLDALTIKYESEKAQINSTCNAEIKKLEIENKQLQASKADSKTADSKSNKTSTVTTQGTQSPAVNAGDNSTININNKP